MRGWFSSVGGTVAAVVLAGYALARFVVVPRLPTLRRRRP